MIGSAHRLDRRRLSVRDPRLPAVARPAHGQRAGRRQPPDRAGAVRVLRARGPRAAARERRAHPRRAQPRPRADRAAADDVRPPHPALRRRRARGAHALRPQGLRLASCRAPCASPRRRATACRSRSTTPTRAAQMRTTASRSRSSNVDSAPPRRGLGQGLALLLGEPQARPHGVAARDPDRADHRRTRASRARASTRSASPSSSRACAATASCSRCSCAASGSGWELIAGERRWRAAQAAGLTTVPALVREADDRTSLALALVENIVRADLDPVEQARGYARLQDEFGLSHAEVATAVGRSRTAVVNATRLLGLPDDVLELLERGELSEGHGRALLQIEGQDERREAARAVVAGGLSVRQTEALARTRGRAAPRRAPQRARLVRRRARERRGRWPLPHARRRRARRARPGGLPCRVAPALGRAAGRPRRAPGRARRRHLSDRAGVARARGRPELPGILVRPSGRLAQSVRAPL